MKKKIIEVLKNIFMGMMVGTVYLISLFCTILAIFIIGWIFFTVSNLF